MSTTSPPFLPAARLHLFLLCLLIARTILANNLPCYFPDETTIANKHIQCNSSASNTAVDASACCRDDPSSYCVNNGLCLMNGQTYRGSCTDKTFKSPSCAQECLTGHLNDSTNVLFQSPNTFGCGLHDGQFVDKNPWFITLRDDQKSALPSSTSASNSTNPPHLRSNLDKRTLAVGLGVGLPLFILLLAALYLIHHQHRQLRRAEHTGSTLAYISYPPSQGPSPPPPPQDGSFPPTQGPSPPPPNSAYAQGQSLPSQPSSTYMSPIAYLSATGFGPREPLNASVNAKPLPSDPRPLQEVPGDGVESHELDGDAFAGLRPSRSTHKFI